MSRNTHDPLGSGQETFGPPSQAQVASLALLGFGVPFAVYVWTMAHTWALDTIYAIDGAEMVIAARTLGIDHPPGHPLYLILAHLFSLLPFPSPDSGVILVSAVFGALAAAFLALAVHERTGSVPVALGSGWMLAFGFIFWIHATIAEVYALQLCFLALFLYVAVRWVRTRREHHLYLLVFLVGLGATTNILLAVLLAPATVYLLARGGAFVEDGKWQGSRIPKALTWGAVGLTPFLYIPLRLAPKGGFISDFVYLNGYELQSPRWYWWYLTAEEFTGDKVLETPLARYPGLIWDYTRSYAASATPVAPILAAVGACGMVWTRIRSRRARDRVSKPASPEALRREERRARRFRRGRRLPGIWARVFTRSASGHELFDTTVSLALLVTVIPVLSYQVPDRDVFYMPSFLFMTAFAGLGLHRVLGAVSARLPGRLRAAAPVFLALVLPSWLLVRHGPAVAGITGNQAPQGARLERFENLPENAVIIGEDDGHATRYKYFQIVAGLREDVTVETMGHLAPRYRGEISLTGPVPGDWDPGAGLNVADRLRVLNGLLDEHPDRPVFAILDDRMPPEFGHFRMVRSTVDPYLLRVAKKPPAEESPDPLQAIVISEGRYDEDIRFVGFGIEGLDRGDSKAFGAALQLGGRLVDAIVHRGELFELSYVVQHTGESSAQIFAEFAFVNDRMEIPSAHGFSASRSSEVLPASLPPGWYRKDRITFKIPRYIPGGYHTLAVKASRATGEVRGSYQGRAIRTLSPVETRMPWKGQNEYRPLGRVWLE